MDAQHVYQLDWTPNGEWAEMVGPMEPLHRAERRFDDEVVSLLLVRGVDDDVAAEVAEVESCFSYSNFY